MTLPIMVLRRKVNITVYRPAICISVSFSISTLPKLAFTSTLIPSEAIDRSAACVAVLRVTSAELGEHPITACIADIAVLTVWIVSLTRLSTGTWVGVTRCWAT